MLSVSKVYEGIRLEGLNCGLPMLFVLMGNGRDFSKTEDLVKEIYFTSISKKGGWVCILGEETVRVGIGSLIKDLSKLGLNIEVEVDGNFSSPGWMHTVDRWVVDYREGSLFNYFALRPQDMIRFSLSSGEDVSRIVSGFEEIKLSQAVKYILIKSKLSKLIHSSVSELHSSVFELVKGYDKSRVYFIKGE